MTNIIGAGVSIEEASICIIHKDRDEIEEGRGTPNPESTAEFLSNYADQDVHLQSRQNKF